MDTTGILNAVSAAGTGVLAVRLFSAGLSQRYRAFFRLLIFTTIATAAVLPLSISSDLYQKLYVLIEPIYWVFYAWVVLEIYSLVLEGYQGLATVGRWALIAALSVSLLGSTTTLLIPHRNMQTALMSYYPVAERAVYFSLVVFLLAILFILLHYPIVLSPNIVSHTMIFSLYFLCNAALYTVLSLLGPGLILTVGYAMQVATLAALGAWLVLLQPAREKRPVRDVREIPREQELIDQLDSLNQALLRAIRK